VANLRKQADLSEATPTVDGEDRKCTRCGEVKPLAAFHRTGPGKWRSQCARCRSEVRKVTEKRLKVPPAQARRYRIAAYGITPAQYDQILEAQGHVCAICRRPPRGSLPLTIDHCHETGRVRAALCGGCNRWLGIYERFRRGVDQYDEFLIKYGNGNPLLGYGDA
jgi:hypothetical protein